MKKIVSSIPLDNKRVLVRVDFNVPLDDHERVTNDKRILAAVPTIQYLLDHHAAVILMSHLGRPKGKVVPQMSLAPVAKRLAEILKKPVMMAPDCVGPEVKKMAGSMKPGQILMLENLRFHPEEEQNDLTFAKELASLGDVFIQDAFGTVHRAHASTVGIVPFVKASGAGFLVEKELKFLGDALNKPVRPFLAILGGAKVSDKIDVIENLLGKVDSLIIGGAMAYTFLKAQGVEIGNSLLEADKMDIAKDIMQKAEKKNIKILLPIDHVVVDKIDFAEKKVPPGAIVKETEGADIPEGFIGVDIGSMTVRRAAPVITESKTIIWNGPMGVFEIEQFAKGTVEVAKLVAAATDKGSISVVGGGDSIAAVKKAGVDKKITHISTGGGASLEFLEGKELPGIAALPDA